MADQFVLKLLIVASIVTYCYADMGTQLMPVNETTRIMIEEAKTYKHPRCFTPYQINCNVTYYPGYDFDMTRWYYHVHTKSCLPVYVPRSQIKICPGVVDYVINLLYTKKECEDVCGEPCTVIYPNHRFEPGICMRNCDLKIPPGYRRTCPAKARCCPRDYEPRFLPTTEEEPQVYTVESAHWSMAVSNKSIIGNFTVKGN